MAEIIYNLIHIPFAQVLLFLLLTILLIFVFRPKNVDQTWVIAGYVFIAFILLNSILIYWAASHWLYFFYSLGCSVLYIACISFIIPTITKLLKVEGSGESAMVFLFILYHPIALLFVMSIKWIVDLF